MGPGRELGLMIRIERKFSFYFCVLFEVFDIFFEFKVFWYSFVLIILIIILLTTILKRLQKYNLKIQCQRLVKVSE